MESVEKNEDPGFDVLKRDFKRYKDKNLNVHDVVVPPMNYASPCTKIDFSADCEMFEESSDVYEIKPDLGFFYIPNPFKPDFLTSLLHEAITVWPDNCGKTNLDIESDKPPCIWDWSLNAKSEGKSLKETWLYKLRWTSLGYHYHWTEQEYVESDRSTIPSSLAAVSKALAAKFGYPNFEPEAGIVNYYHLNSTMGFHVDKAEEAQDVPLISISFGQSAVYLLGGLTRAEASTPLLLRHGDVVLMTGRSRLAYHAVPRVTHGPMRDLRPLLEPSARQCAWCRAERPTEPEATACPQPACRLLWQYLNVTRVNVNVRQVFPRDL